MVDFPSLSARRAWIEIRIYDMSSAWNRVALRKESVDRNCLYDTYAKVLRVSLSARRAWIEIAAIVFVQLVSGSLSARRAWIEISIDDLEPSSTRRSLSARRAWIEIRLHCRCYPCNTWSLSARRAWIEIKPAEQTKTFKVVALRKESVDRN